MWQSFEVGAVVESLPVIGAEVVAGAGGLTRRITRARLAATVDDLRRVAAGDFVVATAATLLSSAETPERLVTRLNAAQIAGLAVRLDADDRLPPGMETTADRVSLPIIAFPQDTALADLTAAVLDAVLDAQRQRLQHVLDIHHRFTRTVVAGGGAEEVAAALHDLVGWTVAVVDHNGRPIVTVPADGTIDLDPQSHSTVRQPIVAGEHRYGAIVAASGPDGLDADGTIAMERAALGLAVRLAQAAAVTEAQERFAAVSLEELISGHLGSVPDVAERAASLGWDLNRPRAVLLASVDPPGDGSTPANALGTIAAAARATLGPEAIVWTRSATIAALIAPNTDDPAERREIAEGLRRELDGRLHSANVSVGVGRRVESPTLLRRSFTEASRAVEVGRWARGRHVTEVFDDLGLERLLASTPTDDLAEFVRHAIGDLVAHDRAHGSELVDTLAVWLETRNMAEAARRMFVHHNTLKNRLDRVEAIIGPIIDDAARALECEVAIYVSRHYDVRWETHP